MIDEHAAAAMAAIRNKGFVRAGDLEAAGVPRHHLRNLVRRGALERVGRGVYAAVPREATEHHTLAEAAVRVPAGVICLLSALSFHGLTTQQPFAVWIALHEKAWQPRFTYPPVKYVRYSGPAWTYGVQRHTVEGIAVRVYSPAKTVADCFKYRNKIGIDVAVEALRDVWRQRLASLDALVLAAAACRMQRVMTPYLRMLA